jgi:glyceraldehyde 3-phosphate dehydrogenase
MKTKIAINGFGRIGRNAFKIAFGRSDLEIVAINDLTDTKTLAYLLKHDSNYGTYEKEVGFDQQNIIVEGQSIKVLAEKDPAALPWADLGVEVVIESTGRFTKKEDAELHLKAGAKRVIISGPTKSEGVDTIVLGANEDKLGNSTPVISNASCTTNSLGAVMAILDSNFGVEKSLLTTVHSYTASQALQDAPNKDLREGRNAAENIVPTTTGAAIAVTLTLPQLKDKFDGLSIRVPTPVVSLSDITSLLKKAVTVEEVNQAFKKAAAEPFYQGILGISEEELVSSDYIGDSHSGIVDLPLTKVVGGNLVKVMVWYDNEWGYSNRLVELTADIGKLLHNDSPPPAGGTGPQEKQLEAPSPEDFLPAPDPLGQEAGEPAHNTTEEHSPVEGVPGAETPADTAPQQGQSAVSPESQAGPDKPHEF